MQNEKQHLCPVIAITGRSGSGKSTVSQHYALKGYTVIDGDKLARDITKKGSECLEKLAAQFGADILDENKNLNRALLAKRAFENQQTTKALNAITHPAIFKLTLDAVKTATQNGEKLVFLDGAAIVGSMFEEYCSQIIVVVASEQDAVTRIVMRDNISKTAARQRLAAQTSESILRQKATYIIENNKLLADLTKQADEILLKILSHA